MTRHVSACLALVGIACAPKPPSDFAPSTTLVQQIREIRIIPQAPRACPGTTIHATYEAILADGSTVPFAESYSRKQPPTLHVQFLELHSPDAVARDNGDWAAEADPLATISTGFRLTAALRADPKITNTIVVPPTYECMDHRFILSGTSGGPGFPGGNGPDVKVTLDIRRSPFYERLFVASVQENDRKPFYVLADSSATGVTEWLEIDSRGGDGGNGRAGSDGIDGMLGSAGCPGERGGNGTNGSDGGAGGDGGDGGRITIVLPPNRPELAKMVKTSSWGGNGGFGGPGGHGGAAGRGGPGTFDMSNHPCDKGADGSAGLDGSQGRSGLTGSAGPRTTVVLTP